MGKKKEIKTKKEVPKAKKPEKGTIAKSKEPKVSYYLCSAIFRGHVITLLEQLLMQCGEDLLNRLKTKKFKIENVHDPDDLQKFFPQEWDRKKKKGFTKISFLSKSHDKTMLKEGVLFTYEFIGRKFILLEQKILNQFDIEETLFGDVPFRKIKEYLVDQVEFKTIDKRKVQELKSHFKARVEEKKGEKVEARSEHLPKIGADEKAEMVEA